jgi:hypothetical protein
MDDDEEALPGHGMEPADDFSTDDTE